MGEEQREYVRIRTNITARLPDPDRKNRDSFERTVEIVKLSTDNIEEAIKEANELLELDLILINKMGGKPYTTHGDARLI